MIRLFQPLSAVAVVAAFTISSATAAIILDYDSGLATAPTVVGAADPASQGWAFNGPGAPNQFAAGYDSGISGWRTVDGTTTAPAYYSQALGGGDVATLTGGTWSLNTTFLMDSDARGSSGGFVDNYYLGRTDDNMGLWLENSSFAYRLAISVGTGPHELFVSNAGVGSVQVTVGGSGFDVFHTLRLASTDGGATADLFFDNVYQTTYTSLGVAGSDRVVFGAINSLGQGSATWNQVALHSPAVPEPGTIVLYAVLGLAGFCLLARSGKKMTGSR